MAGSRLPGPLGAGAEAERPDPGTLALVQMPPPGVVDDRQAEIDPTYPMMREHLAYIDTLRAGNFALDTLRVFHREQSALMLQMVTHFGPDSLEARLVRLALNALDEMISARTMLEQLPERADSAIDRFEELLDRFVRGGRDAPGLVEVKDAMNRAITLEHDREVTGQGEAWSRLGPRVVQALDIGFDQHRREVIDLAERGLRNPDEVSDQQVMQAVATMLGDERQRELMGGPERFEEANQALRRASELWLRKRTLELQRAYATGSESRIAQAEQAYEAAKRAARERGVSVSEASVRTGLPSTAP